LKRRDEAGRKEEMEMKIQMERHDMTGSTESE